MFFSNAYVYPEAFCSICDQRYGDCDPLKGQIYMGQICRRKIPESVFREVSVVFSPEDKRCRIAEYSKDGKVFCTLTRRELPRGTPIDPAAKFVRGRFQYFD